MREIFTCYATRVTRGELIIMFSFDVIVLRGAFPLPMAFAYCALETELVFSFLSGLDSLLV